MTPWFTNNWHFFLLFTTGSVAVFFIKLSFTTALLVQRTNLRISNIFESNKKRRTINAHPDESLLDTMRDDYSDGDANMRYKLCRETFVEWAASNITPINDNDSTSFKHKENEKIHIFTSNNNNNKNDENCNIRAMKNKRLYLNEIGNEIKKSSTNFVMLSEGYHNCKEIMELHLEIIQYLVQEHGFNTVMTESGLPESRIIYDYVLDNKINSELLPSNDNSGINTDRSSNDDSMWSVGLNKMYSEWKEGRELIEWMRSYNRKNCQKDSKTIEDETKLLYYGVDIGGFYTNWHPAMNRISSFLLEVGDTDFHDKWFHKKMQPFLNILGTTSARQNYQNKLDKYQKLELALILGEVVSHLCSNERKYVEKLSLNVGGNINDFCLEDAKHEFEWIKQTAISMQMAENYYRNYEDRIMNSKESGGTNGSIYSGLNGREIAMTQNVLWAMKQRKSPKVIVINHVIHTKTETQYQDNIWGYLVPLGQMLKDQFNLERKSKNENYTKIFIIGMLYGGGKFWNKWQTPGMRYIDDIPPYKEDDNGNDDGIENVMKRILKYHNAGQSQKQENEFPNFQEKSLEHENDLRNFYLPWYSCPTKLSPFMSNPLWMRENDYFIRINPREWNACIYLDNVSPSTPTGA